MCMGMPHMSHNMCMGISDTMCMGMSHMCMGMPHMSHNICMGMSPRGNGSKRYLLTC
jgi:hypothetical protein